MSHSSKIFDSAPIQVQNKNGFDLSHLNVGTAKCGQLVPVMCKILPPNTDFTLGVNMEVSLPPLAVPFFGRVDAIVEGFVCPLSILYGGWKQFISNQPDTMFPANQSSIPSNEVVDPFVQTDSSVPSRTEPNLYGGRAGGYNIPYIEFHYDGSSSGEIWQFDFASNDNIYEYLGIHFEGLNSSDNYYLTPSLLPALCYHRIWDVWYRNKQVTRTIFGVNTALVNSGYNIHNVSLIWHSFLSDAGVGIGGTRFDALSTDSIFPDGIPVWHTRQRNYSRDYFTAGSLSPQQGTAAQLHFDTSNGEAGFTIGALRAANSLAKFLETNNLNQEYNDIIRNRWGAKPIDADFEEPYYLGRVVIPVYQKTVYQQDNSSTATAVNPFAKQGATGTRAAAGGFRGEGSIAKKFHNSTWSYVMCLFSLVPHAMYAQGANRELFMKKIGDFPAPEFQTIGYEAVYQEELFITPINTGDEYFDPVMSTVFSYIPRYSRFKYMDDEVHGEMRPGRTLESFVLQRDFASAPQLSTSFLEIPQDALDSVFAVSTSNMNLSCWYEIFFEFKVAMPLADFCIPTLGDLRDTHTIKTSIGGSRL